MTAPPKNASVSYPVRKTSYLRTKDDFPTPPWAVRAFFGHVAPELVDVVTVCEPACGRGHIVRVLRDEMNFQVLASDKFDYRRGFRVADYADGARYRPYDLLLTNPPFTMSQDFALRGLREASRGVALLLPTMWVIGKSRYENLLRDHPPTVMATFARRMSATRGRVIQKGQALLSHSWFWWDKRARTGATRFVLIPPDAQKLLESDDDYTDKWLRGGRRG